jgi:hypothetical protein
MWWSSSQVNMLFDVFRLYKRLFSKWRQICPYELLFSIYMEANLPIWAACSCYLDARKFLLIQLLPRSYRKTTGCTSSLQPVSDVWLVALTLFSLLFWWCCGGIWRSSSTCHWTKLICSPYLFYEWSFSLWWLPWCEILDVLESGIDFLVIQMEMQTILLGTCNYMLVFGVSDYTNLVLVCQVLDFATMWPPWSFILLFCGPVGL